LPKLHRSLYGDFDQQVISCRTLSLNFHRHRMARVSAEDYGAARPMAPRRAASSVPSTSRFCPLSDNGHGSGAKILADSHSDVSL
jgi:hypothetical protein